MLQLLKNKQRGFTLIELLVVIAIIGTLATVVLASLNEARSKARDVRRLADLRQIVLALEMYYDDNNFYPGDANEIGCDDWPDLSSNLVPNYLGSLPLDPGTHSYAYEADSDKQSYILRAQMENDVPDGDVDDPTYGCACDDASNYYCIHF
jgi:type II secretion system protein G